MGSLQNNPWKTYADCAGGADAILGALLPFFDKGDARLVLGHSQAKYGKDIQEFEAFSRPCWAAFALLAGGRECKGFDRFLRGIKNGTDPRHPGYFGATAPRSQKVVEMAVYGYGLILAGDRLLSYFSAEEKANFLNWLKENIAVEVPDNNWNFFRVLVSVGLRKVGWEYDPALIRESLGRIESFYLGDGWYSDGKTQQRDYYISFAMHFYGLLYAHAMQQEEPAYCDTLRRRALRFAKDFVTWFQADGQALPFGRSLTYRFAQTAFWSMCAFTGLRPFSPGVMKGIILRNLRWWMRQPIFDNAGVLSIGYGYENLIMAEDYNSPGSPYWAMKTFVTLALDPQSEFWTCEEEPLPAMPGVHPLPHAHMLLNHDEGSRHVFALTMGQYAEFEPGHAADKYAKFAYSADFGFNITKEAHGLDKVAVDGTLAVSDGEDFYRVHRKCRDVKLEGNILESVWSPWPDVQIKTWLVGLGDCHVRIHWVETGRPLQIAEGGFPVALDRERPPELTGGRALCFGKNGDSAAADLLRNRECRAVLSSGNSNLVFPDRTQIPALCCRVEAGSAVFAAAFFAHPESGRLSSWLREMPQAKRDGRALEIRYRGTTAVVDTGGGL